MMDDSILHKQIPTSKDKHEDSVFYAMMEKAATFADVKQFNKFIKNVRYLFSDQLNDTDKALIDHLSHYAIKNLGACGQKVATIAEALGKGTATVRRSLAKLEGLGILKRIQFIRPKKGGNGANLIVFLPSAIKENRADCPSDCPVDCPQMIARQGFEKPDGTSYKVPKTRNKTLNSFKAHTKAHVKEKRNTYLRITEQFTSETEGELDHTYARNDIPKSFVTAVAPRERTAKAVNFAWSKVVLAFEKSGLADYPVTLDELLEREEVFCQLICRTKSAVRADKHGEIRKDFGALMYGTMKQLFNEIAQEFYAQERRQANQPFFINWEKALA